MFSRFSSFLKIRIVSNQASPGLVLGLEYYLPDFKTVFEACDEKVYGRRFCMFSSISDARVTPCTTVKIMNLEKEKILFLGTYYYIYNNRPSIEKGSDQLFVTLYTLSIYPSVHLQLIRTLFEAHILCINQYTRTCINFHIAHFIKPYRDPVHL